MKNFRLVGGNEIENLRNYLRNYYIEHPRIEFYVGTDSAQCGKHTKYVTTICMLHPEHIDELGKFHHGAGVHVVYKRENVQRIRDVYTRLWHETELTYEVAQYVHEIMKDIWKQPLNNEKVPIVHLDLNRQPKYKSNSAHDASIGYLKGYGFEVYSKPQSWSSSYVADWLCK